MVELEKEIRSLYEGQDDVTERIEDLQKRIKQFEEAKYRNEGMMNAEKRKVEEIYAKLATDKYRNVDADHRKKMIEFETTQLANSDLDKFIKALDKALIQHHQERMREINAVLKELWQTTYRGRDIDYIAIRSEQNSGKGAKQYQYSVVMKQGETEMDLRGRCSAGQRVLSCLLIRIALAETFASKCGILALDEPTTNLDEANIKSLAPSGQ
eukprot:TRINITY_DN5520_c0_g1_i1.p1 TRINITY_DN5520_c0_g1~~TRINITY_DN5520_c0_g1_i1.p1  ORF type:complete len:212 (-),score=54.68 TRINITY_DN5520_c0_g1_i1:214-849(-)